MTQARKESQNPFLGTGKGMPRVSSSAGEISAPFSLQRYNSCTKETRKGDEL